MIGANAKAGFERIFFDAARTRLASGGACEIRPTHAEPHDPSTDTRADRSHANARAARNARDHVAVLTISALHFRLLLALRFSDDDATRRYFVGATQAGGAQRPLPEAFMEVANLCCGAINQALTAPFPDLGMSTPYLLSGASIDYLTALKPDHLAAYDVTLGGDVRIGATLCVCANAPVDFHVPETAAADTGGELELF
ncbi:hypothetical protein K6W16_15210 [Burkholderia dolosa]|uniref:Uncharacterized protein n=1 Tax=Burkholderia dolosa TaxID=152500 RepID=A0A892IG41_9BURK|nr:MULTISPECIES: hypothetical protein [Burkholderia]AKE05684.1 hypothetical protein XM57_24040 [Burkholderia cepacia]AJY09996.1 hypothetical protein AK34_4282 [Burkholderia dolosa AU0158]AYZ93986.1 hypothetical protein EGY28_02120 [Burkholderia dolosa]EAY70298.1 hypothetical protein BDAG_03089 [Burkholderia dolosa AU0158]ETP62272.1 hypothetical protein BDSB_18035 [Burkholderia dolosa PC543]